MSMHDPGQNGFEDADPVSTTPPPTGGALVPQTAGSPLAMGMPAGPQRVDVIRGGMDGASLFHSFRRRWLLALCMGLLCGAGAAVALFFAFPESSSAVAMFKVDSKPMRITGTDLGANTTIDFDTFRTTQIVLLKSAYVLVGALGSPEMQGLSIFADVEPAKRVDWLREELEVTFPQSSEILQIKLTGSAPPRELKTVVEAVSTAYYEEVVFNDHLSRLKPIDILKNSELKLREDIRRKTDDYYALVREMGHSDALSGADPDTSILLTQARNLLQNKSDAQMKLQELNLRTKINREYLTNPAVLEAKIEEAISLDQQMVMMREQAANLEVQMSLYSGSPSTTPEMLEAMGSQLAGLQRQIADYETRLRDAYTAQQEDEPNLELQQLNREYRDTSQVLQRQIEEADQQIASIVENLKEKGEINTDIEMRRAQLEQLQTVQRGIAQRIEEWSVEANAPPPVERIPGIEETPSINRTQRYLISGVGGLATFALTCFGIAYMEFRNRRLSVPEQLDEGLGIRVMGTLPSLSGRKSLDPNHPVVAQLTESIDSVRTALMHESTTKRRQVVLVTSAATLEGRTTVASQLAASLARAGRRTLLIDGDLRRPSLHSLFDVPLEDGLCEVLRAESDITDVVRPTHAEGLWLMTAGYCDADAVHALATDQAQPIFEKLRSDYDFIIIDGAPVLGLADSLLFGQHCDGAILSVLRDHTNLPKLNQSAEQLKSVGIRLMGSVVNGVPIKGDRRVTHLQVTTAKNARKQLENTEA